MSEREVAAAGGGNSTLFNFTVISGAFGVIFGVSGYVSGFADGGRRPAKKKIADG